MKVSAGLPTCMEGMMYPVPFARPEDIIRIARTAEKLGYHSVWGNDHMTTQTYVRQEFAAPPNFWELLITLAFAAAPTKTLGLGMGMLVTPMRRDLVAVAKQIATLDCFSQGRVLLGIGVGAYREEFLALNPGSRAHRGKMVEESLQALRLLFTERRATYEGQYYHFRDVEMYPKPAQNPLPIYIGGNSPRALERTVRYGVGWMPAFVSFEQIRQQVDRLRGLADQAGRYIAEIDVAVQYIACIGRTHEQALARFRASQMYRHVVSLRQSTLKAQRDYSPEALNLIGSPAEVVEQIHRLAGAGVTHLCGTYFVADTVGELLDQMQVFAEDVLPHLP